MLLGEYDFTEVFVQEDVNIIAKLIFVIFVFDMSVVLMNLIVGLAVNDVQSIRRESICKRLTYETYTAIFLETVSALECFMKTTYLGICKNSKLMSF